ncbi:FAD/NAD(P)-binding protein [Gallicola sp. Sow4_E12]|uniref:FAD/NAD(P)-binding protein n=1 Tax=Gallicola sp. Sow4_E12 TaxID=3438785 RepID=UPI003F907D7B
MEKVAIIGMGTSGMAVLAGYEKVVDPSTVSIDCYDSSGSLGKGYPYRMDSDEVILNLKTRKISYNYEDNDDLARWLEENDLQEPVYTPRNVFGVYMKSRMEDTAKKIQANLMEEKIIRIDKAGNQWELGTESGKINKYDRVHLCCGELKQYDYYGLKGEENFIQEIFPLEEKLQGVQKGNICVIGTSLTGVDVATYLLSKNRGDHITMFSRSCMIPTVRVEPVEVSINVLTMECLKKHLEEYYGRIAFEEFDALFLEELESHGIDFEKFQEFHMCGGIEGLERNIDSPDDLAVVQALLPPMNGIFNKVWDCMPVTDRVRFREKWHPFLTHNRSPLPLESAEILIQAKKEHRLSMVKGVGGIKKNGKYKLIMADGKEHEIEYDYIINATGLDVRMREIEESNPLLDQLLEKRYASVCEYGGLTLVPGKMCVISPLYGTLENLHGHGVLAVGVQYRNNSTMMIQKTAHELIKSLYSSK